MLCSVVGVWHPLTTCVAVAYSILCGGESMNTCRRRQSTAAQLMMQRTTHTARSAHHHQPPPPPTNDDRVTGGGRERTELGFPFVETRPSVR